jgi:hypothetical protein
MCLLGKMRLPSLRTLLGRSTDPTAVVGELFGAGLLGVQKAAGGAGAGCWGGGVEGGADACHYWRLMGGCVKGGGLSVRVI